MRKRAFLLLGDHEILPADEVKAVLELLEVQFREEVRYDQLIALSMENNGSLAKTLTSRLAFTRSFGEYLGSFRVDDFPRALDDIDPPTMSGKFRVRAVRVRGCCRELRRNLVERKIGGWILKRNKDLRVDLEDPDKEIVAVLTSGHVVLFLKEGEIDRSLFKIKEVAARPFVHPASMRPTLARAMVNLARVREGDVVLDPFVGVGGIALEILSVGAKVIGVDIDPKMVAEARSNLIAYGYLEGHTMLEGDALHLGLNEKVDRIVTDPPYGRLSASRQYDPEELIRRFIEKSVEYLKSGGFMVLAAPKERLDEKIFASAGYRVVGSYDIREHGSLTRRIWVARLV